MSRTQNSSHQLRQRRADSLFNRADAEWENGNLRSALRLFLAAVKAGDRGSLVNVGYFYDIGIGVRPNRSKALYWYQRAYRRGEGAAAANIGTIWRDAQEFTRAVAWFKRAVKLGDDDANLEIAKLYLRDPHHRHEATSYLEKAWRSDQVTEATAEEAKRLWKKLIRRPHGN
jgi:TPR repeat protein